MLIGIPLETAAGETRVAATPETAKKLVLALVGLKIEAHIRRRALREHFGQLPQLQKAGVGIFRKVAFRQHADPKELLIVLLQMGEIAGDAFTHVTAPRRWIVTRMSGLSNT